MIKIILADDHTIIRDGIRSLLSHNTNIEVVAEASNGKDLLGVIPAHEADVILLDVNMPQSNAAEIIQYITKNHSYLRVLVLSMMDNEQFIKRMIDAGASGYILKTSGKLELINAIQTVASGNLYLSPEIGLKLLRRLDNPKSNLEVTDGEKGLYDISKRELEVLRLISEGLTTEEIADKLFTSKRTVESHRRNLIDKTRTKNSAELIRFAISKGLIEV